MNKNQEAIKIKEFKTAMYLYENNPTYAIIERINSLLVISFQFVSLFNLIRAYDKPSLFYTFIAFVFAYLITDFVNGLVHMYMDNNTHYSSILGPLISVFHLHHGKIKYKNRHPLVVYFFESGTKYWLSGLLLGLILVQSYANLPCYLNFMCVSIGILSSFAEISHYWCHNSTSENRFITFLQKYHILLSKQHHHVHHRNDNEQYAFLNGMTDPLINWIAGKLYSGYKNNADKHMRAYLHSEP